MKRLIGAIFLALLFIFPSANAYAEGPTKAWTGGHYVDQNIPIIQDAKKTYIPVDLVAKYLGKYSFYKPDEKTLIVAKPSPNPSCDADALHTNLPFTYVADFETIQCYFSEAPFYRSGHVYQTVEDASLFFDKTIGYDAANRVVFIGDGYVPGAPEQQIHIVANGRPMPKDLHPFIQHDRTMVPVRFVAESLGAEVYWHPEKIDGMQGLTISSPTDPTMGLTMYIDKCGASESELFFRNDTFPVLRNGTTYVPIRLIANYLGIDVKWDASTRTLTLNPKDSVEFLAYDRMAGYLSPIMDQKFEDFIAMPSQPGCYAAIFD